LDIKCSRKSAYVDIFTENSEKKNGNGKQIVENSEKKNGKGKQMTQKW
jgi:hypothetical protein